MLKQEIVLGLADKVNALKDELREKLLSRRCAEKGRTANRLVYPREITLSREDKQTIMREAFDLVLHGYKKEERDWLKSAIGKELNRRKQERKANREKNFSSLAIELEKRYVQYNSLLEEIAELENQLRQEEECQCTIELLIQSGKAKREENGDLIIFDTATEEQET